jgi:inorganic pyrophosphatase
VRNKVINATRFDFLPAYPARGKREHIVNGVIETPQGSCHKYALEPELGIISYHRVLPSDLHWPYDYGFIPHTLAPDGDALDLLVLTDAGLFSGCLIAVRVLGSVREKKDDVENDRVLAAPLASAGAPKPTDAYRDITDIPPAELNRIKNFLLDYSRREGNATEISGSAGVRETMNTIKACAKAFKRKR